MKKLIVSFVCLLSIFAFMIPVFADDSEEVTTTVAENSKVNVYIFTKESCPYCEAAKEFLNELLEDKEYGEMFELVEYQVWDASWNEDKKVKSMMDYVAGKFGDEVGGAPYIFVGTNYSVNGYQEELDDEIKAGIKEAYEDEDYVDLIEQYNLENPEDDSNVGTIIGLGVTVLIIGGFVALIIFSRKSSK